MVPLMDRSLMSNALFLTLVVLLALTSEPAKAQAQLDSHRDWTGYYVRANNRDLAGTGFKQDWRGRMDDLDKLVTPLLVPWAKARMEATDGTADDNGAVCLPDGIFRYQTQVGQFLWLHESGRVVMVFMNINTGGVRRIYMDRPHPKNLILTWNGDSIGSWDGDTLNVDTVGFNDKSWLFGDREPHTEETRLMERIRMVGDGTLMEIHTTVDDRLALSSPYSFNRYYKLQPASVEMPEYVCNEDPEIWRQFKNDAMKRLMDARKSK